jgi:hypothetical protein
LQAKCRHGINVKILCLQPIPEDAVRSRFQKFVNLDVDGAAGAIAPDCLKVAAKPGKAG